MKRILLSAFAFLCIAGPVTAAPIGLPGNTPLAIQFFNLEQVDVSGNNALVVPGGSIAGTQGNWGVVKVTTIQLGGIDILHQTIVGGGSTIFTSGTEGFVTGLFYGIQLTSGSTAALGELDLYWHDSSVTALGNPLTTGNYAPDAGTVSLFTTGSGGTLLAKLLFSPGIINGDGTTTLTSDINLFGSLTGEGHANGFLDVNVGAGGAWADTLNGNWFFVDNDGDTVFGEPGEQRDVRFRNTFNAAPGWNGACTGAPGTPCTVGLSSSDPATVLTSVPEPATLTLLGLGLVGVARRRRKA